MIWSRRLWGVEYRKKGKAMLIGCLWNYEFEQARIHYDGEPTRAMLFQTRKAARAWLKQRPDGGQNLRIIRVRETVKAI